MAVAPYRRDQPGAGPRRRRREPEPAADRQRDDRDRDDHARPASRESPPAAAAAGGHPRCRARLAGAAVACRAARRSCRAAAGRRAASCSPWLRSRPTRRPPSSRLAVGLDVDAALGGAPTAPWSPRVAPPDRPAVPVGPAGAVGGGAVRAAARSGGGSVGRRRAADDRAEATTNAGRAAGAVAPALDVAVDARWSLPAPPREYVQPSGAGRGAEVRPVLAVRTDEARLVRRVADAVELADRGALAGEAVRHRVGARELERVEAGDRAVEADRRPRRAPGVDDDDRASSCTACAATSACARRSDGRAPPRRDQPRRARRRAGRAPRRVIR